MKHNLHQVGTCWQEEPQVEWIFGHHASSVYLYKSYKLSVIVQIVQAGCTCTNHTSLAYLHKCTHVQITQMSKLARVFKPCAVQILYTNYSCWQAGAISEVCFGGTESNRHPQSAGSELVFWKLLEIEKIFWKLQEIKKIYCKKFN